MRQSGRLMLDIRLIRENPQEVKDRLTARAGRRWRL